jgi:peptidyl-prolyl cis-trans isomerase SurA
MKVRLHFLILMLLILQDKCPAQTLNDRMLMIVDGRDVSAGEFIRMFKKSYEPGKNIDLDSYLQQFLIFKLKVADAVHEGYDTTKAFISELQGYRNQLAQNYLTDPDSKEKLLKQAYQRSLTEINAWHILVNCSAEASPEDTMKVWKKAINIRERIIKGEPFEQVARSTSDDISVKINGGNLGYFTVFQMIMPFEDAVYALKKGEISEPVRTPYGYHIIQVVDKRPSRGKIRVAHIMKTLPPPGTDPKEEKKAESEINSIYKELQKGALFNELATKYSDHKESAVNGGEINWFGAGEITSDFSEAAFSLKKNGDYTTPVKTPYGWHIIKRLDLKAPGSYEQSRSYLESKINQSYLNSLSQNVFIDKLKKEYKFRIYPASFKWFVDNADTLIIMGLSKFDRQSMPRGPLYTFANQQLTNQDFANNVEKRGSMVITKDPEYFINKTIATILSDQILRYENSLLEKKYPEFRYLMNEFHDGILLFEISGKRVWNKAQDDSTGLYRYYEDHKNNYLDRQGIGVKIYSLKKPDKIKNLISAYKKFSRQPDTDKKIMKKFNSREDTSLIIKEGTWFSGDNNDIDKLNRIIGYQEAVINGIPSLVVVNKLIEAEPKPFKNVMGELILSYQEYLENDWVKQLKEKFTVKIDNSVLEEIRKKLKDE